MTNQPAATLSSSVLWQTIVTDLHAGESWFAAEAEEAGLFVWNSLKGAFIALGPKAMNLVTDVLTQSVTDAAGGKTVEQIESDAMNTAQGEVKTALLTAGSGVVQTLIAGIKANQATPPASSPSQGS